jgi:hypothetical protein
MTDLSNLSDDELRALYGKQGSPTSDLSQLSDEDLKAAYKNLRTDTSALSALQQGGADVARGIGSTVKNLVNRNAGKAIEAVSEDKAPKNYRSASQEFAHPSDGEDKHFLGVDWRSAPRALLEQAPGLAMDVGTQMLLKKMGIGGLGRTIGGMLAFGARSAGNDIQKRTDARTGTEGAEPSLEDKVAGVGSTLLQGALNTYGANKLVNPAAVTATGLKGLTQVGGNVAKAALAEGATSTAQSAISDAAATAGTDKGLNIDWQNAKAQGLLGGISGGIVSSRPAAKEAIGLVRNRDAAADEHTSMAANRIKEAGSVDGAKADVDTELKRAASEVSYSSPELDNAIAAAKKGSKLSAAQLEAIDSAGHEQLSSLARQSSVLSGMSDEAGGLSGKAERFVKRHPLWALGGVATPHAAAAMGMDALLPGSGTLLAAGGLGYGLLRTIDAGLGLRSPGKSFAEKFGNDSGQVRPDVAPVAPKPTPFKPDMLDSNLQKIVDKLQNQKRRDTAQEALPLLRQLAERNQPAPEAPGLDVAALNEQIKGAMLMASARRKIEGQRQAEAEAAESPMVNAQGGLDAVRNPAMGKRLNELLSATTALERARRQPEETEAPPIAPEAPPAPQPTAPQAPLPSRPPMEEAFHAPQPEAPPPGSMSNADIADALTRPWDNARVAELQAERTRRRASGKWDTSEAPAFTLPESPHVFKDPQTAARDIYADAVAGGKEIRHAEGFKAGTQRRLAGEEAIYNTISSALSSVQERGAFHKYLSALWGSDSPEVVTQVREHMLAEFPQHAATINKHLSDEAIKGLWTKPKKKK